MWDKIVHYSTGPIMILAGVLWITEPTINVVSGILFILAGLMFCWTGYDYYKREKKKKEEQENK